MHDHDGHGHHHHHDHASDLTETEKLKTLITNWISHNVGHAGSYSTWGARAGDAGHKKTAELISKAAQATLDINALLKDALKELG